MSIGSASSKSESPMSLTNCIPKLLVALSQAWPTSDTEIGGTYFHKNDSRVDNAGKFFTHKISNEKMLYLLNTF